MSFYKIENSLFYGLKCILFIRSIQCQSFKGLGPVLDHFDFFFVVGPNFSAKIPEKLLIKLVLP